MTSSKKSQLIAGIALSTIFGFLLLMAHSDHQMEKAEKVTPGAIRSVSAAPRPIKVESYGLTATGLQLLTNELDGSHAARCDRVLRGTNWSNLFKDRLLNSRIRLAVLSTTKYDSEDKARAEVLKFEHEIRELDDWFYEDPQGRGINDVCEVSLGHH